ncbi:MAG: hypothetical protein P8X68_14065 [Desulfobacterales bacterium]|jgi:hypothetical protein
MIQSLKPRKWSVIQMAAGILMIGLLAGCASNKVARENSGSLKLSSEVSQIFQTYKVLPEYRYYITGSVTKPHVIMGIDQDYTFDSPLWQAAADLSPEQLKKWVDQMLGFQIPTRTFGAYILDPGGKRVGIWYSPYPDVPVEVHPDKRIVVIYRTSFPKAGRH